MFDTFLGRQKFSHLSPEDNQTAVIAAACRRRHQREAGVNCRVEFRFIADSSGHQTSRVQSDNYRLVALDLILARC